MHGHPAQLAFGDRGVVVDNGCCVFAANAATANALTNDVFEPLVAQSDLT